MGKLITDKEIYDAIHNAGNHLVKNLIGSIYWDNNEKKFISENYSESGISINTKFKKFMAPDGNPVLPQTEINQDLLNAGSYTFMVDVNIQDKNSFSIHAPHNQEEGENKFHLQKGKNKIFFQPEKTDNYGALGSALFLKVDLKQDIIKKIGEIRKTK